MFWGTLRTIGVGVGAPMAVAGNAAGVFLYALINVVPSTIVRVLGFRIGYQGGQTFLNKISASGTLERFTEAARVLGLVVVGSMVSTMVKLSTPLAFPLAEGKTVAIQSIFDSILPKFLPLCVVLICYKLMNKGVKGGWIMLGLFAAAILGKFLKIF
jgi:mannose/fructose/N-acetylgalactosamine-specific phosphotransferase system component IID